LKWRPFPRAFGHRLLLVLGGMSDDGIVGALTRTVSGAADMLTCASPRKAGFVPDAPLGAEPEKKEAKEEAKEEEEDMSFGDRALSMFGGKPKKKAEAKSPKASKGDDDEMGFGERALSMFGGAPKKGGAGGLPPNWKKAKDKDGKVYYFNSVTQVRQYTEPRALPKGWTEALHKESGRVYYVHKATRKTTFSFPQESEGDAEDAEEKKEEDGMIGKTLSFATGGMLGGKKKKDADLGRTGTMTKKAGDGAKKEGGGTKETTVFISCTTLIKEVKLCVDASKHPPLDALLDNLVNHKIAAEEAVKNLQTLVGTTLVQQAGMSVKNAKTGVLPHGWLEYSDERSGRAYFYNVHTKTTTWYKPKKDDVAEAAKASEVLKGKEGDRASAEDSENVNLNVELKTHTVAMTGFI